MLPHHGSIISTAMSLIQQATTPTHLHQLHALLLKTSLDRNTFVLTKFLRRFLLLSSSPLSLPSACHLFDQILNPDAFLYNTMIRAYLESNNPSQSLSLFHQMMLRAVAADSFTLSLALQASARSRKQQTCATIHTHVVKLGFVSDVFVQTALLEMYAKGGAVGIARKVFDEMPERDLVSCNVMLAEYVGCGEVAEARKVFDEMHVKDLVSLNTMIHGYAMKGDIAAAREVFDRAHERDLVTWSSMISAYAQSRRSNEALRLFHEMQMAGIRPDEVTMVSVLSSCGDVGALSMGIMIHKITERYGFTVDMKLGTSLVDMYAKCGDMDKSLEVFRMMPEKDALTWSIVILGLANHGLGKLALEFFMDMIIDGIKPVDITFVGVLSACSHAGLVEEGWSHFKSMNLVYSLSPTVEHYGCMVDLLGRAGHIEEARQLIRDMPFESDTVVWRALLGACRIHKNVKIAEEAIIKLIDLEPHVDGHYVLLSNVYAQDSRWDGVASLRKMMRVNNILKMPGSSSIEIENVVHEFVACDRSHPKSNQIYNMLAEMVDKVRHAGYRPMPSLVLQEIDDHSKEYVDQTW